jgi:hypothetical protein
MALKSDRNVLETDISLVCNDVVSKGLVLVYGTAASGVGNETPGVASLVANPSGYKVAGLTLASFVSIDQTRQHRNFMKDEQVVGEKAPLLRKGYVVTDAVAGTPAPGAPAYLVGTGVLSTVISPVGVVATPLVGAFASAKDESGFAKVYINLPA